MQIGQPTQRIIMSLIGWKFPGFYCIIFAAFRSGAFCTSCSSYFSHVDTITIRIMTIWQTRLRAPSSMLRLSGKLFHRDQLFNVASSSLHRSNWRTKKIGRTIHFSSQRKCNSLCQHGGTSSRIYGGVHNKRWLRPIFRILSCLNHIVELFEMNHVVPFINLSGFSILNYSQ